MFEIPAYKNINFMNSGQSDVNAIIETGFTNNIIFNITLCETGKKFVTTD